jgi:replication factor C large subunit
MDLTEKYRPRSLNQLVGNRKAIEELAVWLKEWSPKGKERGAIIYGPPGVGKTSAALAIARDFDYDVIEMNASDVRNYESVKNIAMRGAFNSSLFGRERKKVIILDEADNLSGVEDRGGIRAIVETLRETRQPIILTANDLYALTSKSQSFKEYCRMIKFNRPRKDEILKLLRRIATAEGMSIDEPTLTEIAEECAGDIRSAIRDLEAGGPSYRDREKNVFDILPKIFRVDNVERLRMDLTSLDMEPRDILLWIDENIPGEFSGAPMAKAYSQISRSDIYLGRAFKRQNYSMWRYATTLMSLGYLHGSGSARYSFPGWLREMSRYKSKREIREGMLGKLSTDLHASKRKIKTDILPYLKQMLRNDEMLLLSAVDEFELSEEEASLLTGEEKAKKAISSKTKLKSQAKKLEKF